MNKKDKKYDLLEDLQRLDFSALARGGLTTVKTYIDIVNDDYRSKPWLILGEVKTHYHNELHRWTLDAPANREIWDAGSDHDGVFLVRLSLVGLEFKGAYLGSIHLVGWIDAIDHEDFRVPSSTTVKRKNAPYVPASNPKLWERVRGRRVEISVQAVYPKSEEDDEDE
jgi:hypothetical protein